MRLMATLLPSGQIVMTAPVDLMLVGATPVQHDFQEIRPEPDFSGLQKVQVRPAGSDDHPTGFVELVGRSCVPLIQASAEQAREVGNALGIPAE